MDINAIVVVATRAKFRSKYITQFTDEALNRGTMTYGKSSACAWIAIEKSMDLPIQATMTCPFERPLIAIMLFESDSIESLGAVIQRALDPGQPTRRTELAALISITFSPLFAELFRPSDKFGVDWGEDPPDFLLTSGAYRTSVEVTQITTPMRGAMGRLPHRGGPITSALLATPIAKADVQEMQKGNYPDDKNPYLFYDASEIERAYFAQAKKVIAQKVEKLGSYRDKYDLRCLLIYDKLSSVPVDRQRQGLGQIVDAAGSPAFDLVLVTNGNAYPGDHYLKL